MAQNYPALVVVGLLLLAAVPHGQSQALLKAINVQGRLCCTPTGNCVGGAAGVPGVAVVLNCTTSNRSVMTVAQGVTGSNGVFNLTRTNLQGLIGSLPLVGQYAPCELIVRLPLNSKVCPVLDAATGLLVSVPELVSTILSPVFGLLAILKVALFVTVG